MLSLLSYPLSVGLLGNNYEIGLLIFKFQLFSTKKKYSAPVLEMSEKRSLSKEKTAVIKSINFSLPKN